MRLNRLMSTLLALNAVSALSHCAQFGVLYPLLALWLSARGVPAWEVGLIGSLYWSGMLFGTSLAPSLLHRVSHRTLIVIAACITAIVALFMSMLPVQHAVLPTWISWGFLGGLVGCATGFRWVANESWLYSLVSPTQRGRWVGWHETVIHASQTLGPVIIASVGLVEATGFYWASVFALGMIVAVYGATVPMPIQTLAQHAPSPKRVLQRVWTGLWMGRDGSCARVGLWAGVIDGVLFGMFAVYCTRRGLSGELAAQMMVVFGLGGLLTSLPIGILCDHKGVRYTLTLVSSLGLFAVLCLLMPQNSGHVIETSLFAHPLVMTASALFGVLAGAGLTLSVIVSTQYASTKQLDMGQAVSEVSLAFTAGTMIGPVCAGLVLDTSSAYGYVVLVTSLCVMGLWMNIEQKEVENVVND